MYYFTKAKRNKIFFEKSFKNASKMIRAAL